ncbi:unnamed protein product, partial [Rotaria sp. Silwood1]
MGNLTAVPTLRRTPKVSNSNARQSTVSSVTNGRSLPLPRHETYVVHHNLSSSLDSSLWIAIKNRRKYTPKTNRIKTTRYNIITFLPKNLFEQFHRVANVAFIPLTVILTITAIKDLVEDLKRWRSDAQTNKQIAEVYNKTSKKFVQCRWEDLSVGSIVRVRTNQIVPADILLLSSTSCESTCYLDTAAIDGETNLKQKSIPSCLLNYSKPEETTFELQCDPPNDDIYHF